MEIIIGNVLLKAFLRGTQSATCSVKFKVNKPASPCVVENDNNWSPKEQRHNLPGTPVERLSLQTTVIFAFDDQVFFENSETGMFRTFHKTFSIWTTSSRAFISLIRVIFYSKSLLMAVQLLQFNCSS